MRVIFAGTPEFAAKALEALIQSEHEVVDGFISAGPTRQGAAAS